MGWTYEPKKGKRREIKIIEESASKKEIEDILKKSVITENFESLHSVPLYSDRKLKKIRQVMMAKFYFFFDCQTIS